jgi:hypothetical protein
MKQYHRQILRHLLMKEIDKLRGQCTCAFAKEIVLAKIIMMTTAV